MNKPVAFLFCLFSFIIVAAQDTIRITDFGGAPNSRINAVQAVKKALEACKGKAQAVLVFSKGRYDFWPQYVEERLYYESNTDVIPLRRCPVLLEHLKNITVDGNGSDFIFHDRMQPITIDNCENIYIKNINIDWDIPLTAQGQVMAVTPEYIDVAINAESPYVIEQGKIFFTGEGWKSELSRWGVMEFDKDTKLIAPQTGDESCLGRGYGEYIANEISKGLVRMSHRFKRLPALGNYLVLRHSARDHAGVFITTSRNVTFENINMFQNAGLGILSQYSENLTFKKVNCIPNPAKNRILSGHDDGFHYSNCKGQITADSCRFAALMDDPINVHGTSVQIIKKISSKKLLCKFMHEQSIGFTWARKGEQVSFIENKAMNSFGVAVVQSFVARDPEIFELVFKDDIPAATIVGDALENLDWVPDVLIKNSFFGSNRARGILVTTPGKVIIENNIFESSGSAILISGDANDWFESGAVKDVTIRNNTFNDPCLTSMYQFCEGIISIDPIIPMPDNNKPFHRNINIENNTFHPFDYPVLYAKSTAGLRFNNNTIIRSNRFKAFHARKYMITIEACKAVEIKQNKLQGDVLGKNVRLISTPAKELTLGKNQGITVE
ncbi:right-handed parallel beta-helix repeat-containing protein [Ferruginibacter sp.]|uniref:alpha-1,3-galactosidase-related protein n=1 Tax=Ferruginibacter sp. TaxID=1940288 RepID=UPI0019A6C738|nr:right-handed parallel beta-helix repeat-containing protein [Ferruginibacter sp.]MBC7625682.1 right-handed parallel beta-helix repeat-containing protein [Ferruginibacter sp.]